MITRRTILSASAVAAITVAATVVSTEGPLSAEGPLGARAQAKEERLALKGYDPVAYFTDAKPVEGVASYEYVWDGQRYRFASARHRDMFKANPDKYAPQFGGSCAMNMANGVRRESDPRNWVISNGNLYVFAGQAGAENFRRQATAAATQAAANWQRLKNTPTQ